MDLIVNKILECIKTNEDEIEILKMRLGIEVLIHNILMIGSILIFAKMLGIFSDAVILFIGYGLLKMTAGGIHFKKSISCILGTGAFIICGSNIAKKLELSFATVLVIYIICTIILWITAPQGTENNPVSQKNYFILKRRMMVILGIYLLGMIYLYRVKTYIVYLILIAIVFETFTLCISILKSCFIGKKQQ